MARAPDTIPSTDLGHDADAVLRSVRDSNQPLFITQGGQAAAVMLSIEAYERSEHERQLLRMLARGEKEITAGRGHDLDNVLADVDTLLANDPS